MPVRIKTSLRTKGKVTTIPEIRFVNQNPAYEIPEKRSYHFIGGSHILINFDQIRGLKIIFYKSDTLKFYM